MSRRLNIKSVLVLAGALIIIGILTWQGIIYGGNPPDPSEQHMSETAGIVNTGILVFREGLEAILVLSALTAGLMRTKQVFWKPIAFGSGVGFAAVLTTWFVLVGIISLVAATTSEYTIQAATGLLAIAVLLLVMNWFFHKIYWTVWIGAHNKKKSELIRSSSSKSASATYMGLAMLGFSAIYREGFEVDLFLQTIRMQAGGEIVLLGAIAGLFLTLIVAALTFVAQRKLPYKKMLVFTGIMLGMVLIVMVGENIQEMQQAGWIGTTGIGFSLPSWLGMWFAVFPNFEGITAQILAAFFVIASYFVAEYMRSWRPRKQARLNQAH
ncbi:MULTISPECIES: FTR1 family iron permease [unclassified Sporolactobacillus]|uniref:FTR1 family iron permease n=1 Tax=unclassified Sporolactobacillus TaxID=2628533 RepID=UPI00236844F9|nr:FTR1 family protein [Sporolactobacillus sp. CQH2019]MDD9149948.1 iron permease [Sporolactobacillus sp. CQH2019]